MEGPQQGRANKLLNMSRQPLSVVIGLLTGHLGLNGHLYKFGNRTSWEVIGGETQ